MRRTVSAQLSPGSGPDRSAPKRKRRSWGMSGQRTPPTTVRPMPTTAEITAQLTGPGGPFEVVTEPVGGLEMKVYKDRFRSLRDVAGLATAHGDQTFIVYGDRRISFSEFSGLAGSVAAALRDASASATATGWPCCRPTTPSGAWPSGGP